MNKGSVLKRELKVPKKDISKAHLLIINNLLPAKLTEQEIDILNSFINIDNKIIEVDGMFGRIAKKEVRIIHKLSSSHLLNIIRSLKDKNCLIIKEDKIVGIKPHLVLKPNDEDDFYVDYNFRLLSNEKV